MIEKLKEINRLRNDGEITREEADEMKADLVRKEIKDDQKNVESSEGLCAS